MDYKEIFENIYNNGVWNDGRTDIPLSGPGSSIENTKLTAKKLDIFIEKYKISSIIDIGCGDLTWTCKTDYFNNKEIAYCGIDIVESIISFNRKRYPNNNSKNVKFIKKI